MGDIDTVLSDTYSSIGKLDFDIHIIETEKIARTHLRLLYPKKDIRNVNRIELNEHSRPEDMKELLIAMNDKKSVLMPDAGAPGIADPGTALIRESHRKNYIIKPLLFSSSVTAAIACSGLNGQSFTFHGYLPKEQSSRQDTIRLYEQISKKNGYTQTFIETPYRNKHLWRDLISVLDEATDLSISVELFTECSIIKTASVSDWKKMKWPDLSNKNVVYSLNAKV